MRSLVVVFGLAYLGWCQDLENVYVPLQGGREVSGQLAWGKANRLYFIENTGQWLGEVLYLAWLGGVDVWITQKGVVYDFYKLGRVPGDKVEGCVGREVGDCDRVGGVRSAPSASGSKIRGANCRAKREGTIPTLLE
ncbi:MAG: hypothetical protein ACUVRD_05460 [Bacteroidia bacterium]